MRLRVVEAKGKQLEVAGGAVGFDVVRLARPSQILFVTVVPSISVCNR